MTGKKYTVLTQEIAENIKNAARNIKMSQKWTTNGISIFMHQT